MIEPTGTSEIARLREQIEAECEAMRRALYAPAIVADHDTIAHKYQILGAYQTQLAQLLGEERPTKSCARPTPRS